MRLLAIFCVLACSTTILSALFSGTSFAGPALVSDRSTGLLPMGANDRLREQLEKNVLVQRAMTVFTARDLPGAMKLLQEAKASSSEIPAAEVVMSRWLFATNKVPLASATIEEHLSRFPDDLDGLLLLTEIAMQNRRWTEAILLLDQVDVILNVSQAMKKNPASLIPLKIDVLRLRGDTAANRRDWMTATDCFKEILKLDSKKGFAHWALGRLELMSGDLDSALKQFETGRNLDPTLPQPQLTIAVALASEAGRDKKEVEKWFQTAVKVEGAEPSTWHEYAKWMLLEDRPEDVIRITEKLKPEWLSSRNSQFLKGLAYRYVGETSAAEDIFNKLHEESPEDIESADQLALVLVENVDEAKRARAKQLSDANVKRAPNAETVIASAAWIEFKLGSIDTADRILGQLAASTSISPQTAYYISEVLAARGKPEEAKKVLESAGNAPGLWVQRRASKTK